MYITSWDDVPETFNFATRLQRELVQYLDERGCDFGFFTTNGEWETAVWEDSESTTYYWQIHIRDTVARELIREATNMVQSMTRCNCAHDCCGHYFLSSVVAGKRGDLFIVSEGWQANV
jgi:hypothetical protein